MKSRAHHRRAQLPLKNMESYVLTETVKKLYRTFVINTSGCVCVAFEGSEVRCASEAMASLREQNGVLGGSRREVLRPESNDLLSISPGENFRFNPDLGILHPISFVVGTCPVAHGCRPARGMWSVARTLRDSAAAASPALTAHHAGAFRRTRVRFGQPSQCASWRAAQ